MKRKLFVILLALAICVSAAVPAMAASVRCDSYSGPSVSYGCGPYFSCWLDCSSYCPTSEEPSQPEQPTEPEQPAEPDEPSQPEQPSKPDEPSQPEQPSEPETPDASSGVHEYERQVLELVNAERAKNGLQPLTLDAELCSYARVKSQDMHDNGYFDHTSPTYGSPFDMMRQFGITYASAGENIAMGYSTPEAVVNAWMNSAGHRANILSSSYTRLGVGYVADGGYWTQWFIG